MRRLVRFIASWFNAALLLGAGAVFLLASHFEMQERLHEFSRAHEEWELDEIMSLLMVIAITVPIFLVRWNRLLAQAHRQTAAAEAEAQQIALHDPLTGLANRRSLHQHVERLGAQSCDDKSRMAVLLLDLDRFKPVNDLRGHQAGDLLLCEVAHRLRRSCPGAMLIARLGGDEFLVLLKGKKADDDSSRVARQILAALAEPFEFDGWSATISCSIGISAWNYGTSSADLLRQADQAMYRAKQAGRATYTHYDDVLGEELRERAALEEDLRRAIETGAIIPFFQPIYDVEKRQIRSLEVLARWPDPVRGYVRADVFVALAEELGLIDRLSDLVLDKACAAAASWPTELPISFNLSPRQFGDLGLPGRILKILGRYGLPGSRLEVEITEHAVLADMDVARQIIGEAGGGWRAYFAR